MNAPRPEARVNDDERRRPALDPSTVERLLYLSPRRYFRFYMLYIAEVGVSCWLPEGFLA